VDPTVIQVAHQTMPVELHHPRKASWEQCSETWERERENAWYSLFVHAHHFNCGLLRTV